MERKYRPWVRPATQVTSHWLATFVIVLATGNALWLGATPLLAQTAATPTSSPGDFYYTVRRGESWGLIAERFGLTVRALQAANPQAVRYRDVLRIGEQLLIPGAGNAGTPGATATAESTSAPERAVAPTPAAPAAAGPQEYVVRRGDGWSTIAERFNITLRELVDANRGLVRDNYVLYVGDRLQIPGGATAASAAEPATPTEAPPSPTQAPNPTATLAPTAQTSSSSATTVTGGISARTTITAAAGTVTNTTGSGENAACPPKFADYPAAITAVLAAVKADTAPLDTFLQRCGAQVADGIHVGDWNGDGTDDLVLLFADPSTPADATVTPGDLMVFDGSATGYQQAFRARAAGAVTLFALEDINKDGQPDVSWVDRTCGASTCFDTVSIISWDGTQWRTWTPDAITLAFADIKLEDTSPTGQGDEIILTGGDYGSVGAGPQRKRTETWGSVNGAPYTLLDRVYAASNCLYHTVLDANEALRKGTVDSLAQAEALYTKAATDQTLEKCWTRENELDELRSFSLFRLALTAAYQGKTDVVADLIGSLGVQYKGSIYDQVGQSWLKAYSTNHDIGAACSAANAFATEHPEAYELLADYGYANPTFAASDVCPVLDLDNPALSTSTTSTSTTPISTTSTSTTPTNTPPTSTGTLTLTAPLTTTGAALPTCPADLSGYPIALAALLDAAGGDPLVLETWLRECDAMSDDRGGFVQVDSNGDGVQDAVFWPTVISELGFGPDGAQGDLLIYHGLAAGGYQLAANEEVYGQPTLIAAEDLNNDGHIDLAWQVVGCSTFCVLEVQIVSWTGDDYGLIIQPGATIAEGSARFESLPAGEPGAGKQLVLEGGISGTAEGGLAVPHSEVWQSINSAAFQRIRWSYDRSVEGNDCMGLRLVEADVALQAASVLGYEPAISLYRAAVDPALKPCSILGMPAQQELQLLQGLASFRLSQAEALNGDLESAQATVDALNKGQPDSDYAKAATQWLTTFADAEDAQAACDQVKPIFTANELLWQVTDNFGYNHPALGAEQICYVP